MNGKRLAVSLSMCCMLVVWCAANAAQAEGVIVFQGAIVERPCSAGLSEGSVLRFKGCPSSGSNSVDVEQIGPSIHATGVGGTLVKARLLAPDVGVDLQYVLVDAAGQSLRTGSYVVTVSPP